MRKTIQMLTGAVVLAFAGIASANPVIDVWTCSLNEGKTVEDVEAAGKMWVEVVRRITGNNEISSSMAISIVGDATTFKWFDTYPSHEVYAAAQTAMSNSEEYEPVGEALDAATTCTGNQLYSENVM